MDTSESLLKAILATVARQTFSPEELSKIVSPTSNGKKQLLAYNLCDGSTSQTEIAKRAKLDQASLSRSIARWSQAGIVIRIGNDQFPLHLYPVPKEYLESRSNIRVKSDDR